MMTKKLFVLTMFCVLGCAQASASAELPTMPFGFEGQGRPTRTTLQSSSVAQAWGMFEEDDWQARARVREYENRVSNISEKYGISLREAVAVESVECVDWFPNQEPEREIKVREFLKVFNEGLTVLGVKIPINRRLTRMIMETPSPSEKDRQRLQGEAVHNLFYSFHYTDGTAELAENAIRQLIVKDGGVNLCTKCLNCTSLFEELCFKHCVTTEKPKLRLLRFMLDQMFVSSEERSRALSYAIKESRFDAVHDFVCELGIVPSEADFSLARSCYDKEASDSYYGKHLRNILGIMTARRRQDCLVQSRQEEKLCDCKVITDVFA